MVTLVCSSTTALMEPEAEEAAKEPGATELRDVTEHIAVAEPPPPPRHSPPPLADEGLEMRRVPL